MGEVLAFDGTASDIEEELLREAAAAEAVAELVEVALKMTSSALGETLPIETEAARSRSDC